MFLTLEEYIKAQKSQDPISALRMEREENEHRIDLTPSEKVEIAMRIEGACAGRQGQRTDLQPRQNFAEVEVGTRPRDIAAKAVDMNRETYRQAKAVVNSGNEEIIQQMDTGEKSINAAYKSVSKVAPIPGLKTTLTRTPEYNPNPEPFKPKTFKITLRSNPEDDAKELLSIGGSDYCTKLAIVILKAAGHSIVDEDK